MKFKIGRNYRQSDQKPYDYIVVRHIPIAPTTFSAWGVTDLANFDSEPTWKFTTPHNIRRWTTRTDTTGNDGDCGLKCHNNQNKELDTYLRSKDMEFDYDHLPNQHVIIPTN
jgi:hypothetical protein